ncbi:MAG: amidohydrolase family protein [Proteobacteria bacterium]|nr:amidohydrolase family protein [Pseudomonadota bacterium]
MHCDLLIKNAQIAENQPTVDIVCTDGKITAIGNALNATAEQTVEANGYWVSPPFVDCHFHLDATLSAGNPRRNKSGTLLEGIQLWGELKRQQTAAEIVTRAMRLCRWSIAKGVLAIRSHVDVSDPSLTTVEALLQVREQMRPYMDIQLVAFPQDGYFRDAGAHARLLRALDMGVDIVGGIPHFERTMQEGNESVVALCRLAAERGLRVDMHCDETDDPQSRHIETLASETIRHGLAGRVSGSHLTSLHSMDNYYATKLLTLIAEANVAAIPNPLINITLQGRQDTYPKRRGLTRIKEMWANGINVAFGHDCVQDPWYSLGTHDMLEVAHMAIHAGLLTAPEEMRHAYEAVTNDAATVFGLENYGIKEGDNADFIILQAKNPIEAICNRATRLFVIRRGHILAQTAPLETQIQLMGKTEKVDFSGTW